MLHYKKKNKFTHCGKLAKSLLLTKEIEVMMLVHDAYSKGEVNVRNCKVCARVITPAAIAATNMGII